MPGLTLIRQQKDQLDGRLVCLDGQYVSPFVCTQLISRCRANRLIAFHFACLNPACTCVWIGPVPHRPSPRHRWLPISTVPVAAALSVWLAVLVFSPEGIELFS